MSGRRTRHLDAEAIMDAIQEAVFLIDRQKILVKTNAAGLELLGRTEDDVVGRSCAEVVNCEACHRDCPFERVMATGEPERRFDIPMAGPDGRLDLRICLTSRPFRNAGGAVTGLVESVRDVAHIHRLITERDGLNQRLQLEVGKVRAILDSVPDGIYTIDTDWRITSFNRVAEEITGWPAEEATGNYCYQVLDSTICHQSCPLRKTLETGQPEHEIEGTITNRRGETRRLLFSTAVFQDPEQGVRGGVEVIRDLGVLHDLLDRIPGLDVRGDLVGSDPHMQRIFNLIEMIKDNDSTVLLTGESGTGKSMLAHEIHRRSKRRSLPFVKISCAALAENLLESELFGHVKGAFTGAVQDRKGKFEAADGGTVFLDEIGEVPLATQVKLLRFLQEQEFERVGSNKTVRVNVRIIAATHRDLLQMVRDGRFREDFYYRLAVIPVHVPPLRERPGDLGSVMQRILERLARRLGTEPKSVSPDVMELFRRHPWPGNIRELENVLEHGFVCTPGRRITVESLPGYLRQPASEGIRTDPAAPASRETAERDAIAAALERAGGRMAEAARDLGVDRTTLWRKMKRHGLKKNT
jgi:PAS domain S-box-containing protein